MTPTFEIVHQAVRISLDIFSQRDLTGGSWGMRGRKAAAHGSEPARSSATQEGNEALVRRILYF